MLRMHSSSAHLRVVPCAAVFLITLAQLSNLPSLSAQANPDLTVDYTGRLFGYYRMEPTETISKTSTGPRASDSLQVVRHFLEKRNGSSILLLGMGDNFAPEFGASIQQEFRETPCSNKAVPADPKQWKTYAPESLYKSEDRKPALADCDNVSRFLMTAGYRAIVPGREDFIYTGTWLRRVAYLLRGASDLEQGSGAHQAEELQPRSPNPFFREQETAPAGSDFPANHEANKRPWTLGLINNTDHKLHMLAANLRVKVASPDATPGDQGRKKDETSCPLLFADDLAANYPCAKGDPTITANMDWLRRIDSTLASKTIEGSLIRQSPPDSEFRKQLLANQLSIVLALLKSFQCTAIPQKLDEFPKSEIAADHDPSKDVQHEKEVGLALENFASSITPSSCPGLASLPSGSTNLQVLARNLAVILNGRPDEQGQFPSPLLSVDDRKTADRLFLRLIAREQKDAGYTIATLPSGKHVLIIGVVGQETMQETTPDYFNVLPDDQDCRTPYKSDSESPVCKVQALARDKQTPFGLSVGDPRFAVSTVLRAAWMAKDTNDSTFDMVVVMAQMPPTEAEELGAHVRTDIEGLSLDEEGRLRPERPSIDLILSEADSDHATSDIVVGLTNDKHAPVFTPYPASARLGYGDPDPISEATMLSQQLEDQGSVTRVLKNHPVVPADPRVDYASNDDRDPDCQSAACRLKNQLVNTPTLKQIRQNVRPSNSSPDLSFLWDLCEGSQSCQSTVLMQYLLHLLQRSSGADIALLKRRDFYFGKLSGEYGNYKICETWIRDAFSNTNLPTDPSSGKLAGSREIADPYCQLHVALDRVLWKGDYSERIMVDGTTLTTIMKTAQQQTDQEQTLLARDLHQEWLMTFGIATTPSTNLVAAASGPESFSVTGIPGCNSTVDPPIGKASGNPTTAYCVDGLSVASDHAYWISTTDQLAEDKTVYSALGALASKGSQNVSKPQDLFLTTEIAREVLLHNQPFELKGHNSSQTPKPTEQSLVTVEKLQQNRRLLQVDVSKLVVGYTMLSPNMSDNDIAKSLSGVSNTQATTPHSQELDLESAVRLTSAPLLEWFALGLQTDFEYDRKVSGNLNGNPEAVTYSPNSYTVGGFTQFQLHSRWPIPYLAAKGINKSTRNLPRAFLVIAPYQFQRQITGAFVSFPYFTPPNTPNPQQQLTIHVPTAMGFSQRFGIRYEPGGLYKWGLDAGSYSEIGPEYSVQNNILSALLLPQLPAPYNSCPVSATQSLQACVKANYKAAGQALNGSSVITPVTQTLHTGGFYWNAHFQKVLDSQKRYSVSFDTSGDDFLLPDATLTTQTRYASLLSSLSTSKSSEISLCRLPTPTSSLRIRASHRSAPASFLRPSPLPPSGTSLATPRSLFTSSSGLPGRHRWTKPVQPNSNSLFAGTAENSETKNASLSRRRTVPRAECV